MIHDTPYIKALVCDSFIKGKKPLHSFTECYIFAVACLPNRPHLFTIHTVDGAIYSRLPVWAFWKHKIISTGVEYFEKNQLEPWGVIGEASQVITYRYLKDFDFKLMHYKHHGRYLFTIEPTGGAFAEDPEQSKSLHFLALNNGQFALLPNNYLDAQASFFTKPGRAAYHRNRTYFTSQG